MMIYGKHAAPIEAEWIRVDQAAAMIGLSVATLNRLAKAGRLKTKKVGGARNSPVLFCVRSIREFLNTTTEGNGND